MKTNKNMVVAIDGPAASGKGTLARKIAQELNFAYLDTGALYRATAYEVTKAGGDPECGDDAAKAVKALNEKLSYAQDPSEILGNPALRTDETGSAASCVAAIQPVRDALLTLQKNFAQNPGDDKNGAILDGRDIGTVICPDADVKLFITASVEVRAERRLKELQSKGLSVTSEAVLKDMRARDERDASRQVAPMKPAEDAIVIDTSDLNAEAAYERALDIIKDKAQIA